MRRSLRVTAVWAIRAAIAAALAAPLAAWATADLINFDPDGGGANGAIVVASIDYQPGNGIFAGLGPADAAKVNQPFSYLFQARVDNLLDSSSNVIPVAGLNQPGGFELTAIFGFSGIANGAGGGAPVVYSLSGRISYFQLYFDDNPLTQANDLTGFGFDDGTSILSGGFNQADGSYAVIPSVPLPLFDGFGVDDYAGFLSQVSAGGGDYSVGGLSADPAFFLTAPPILQLHLFNSSNVTPFDQVNPSQVFQPNFPNYVPNLGAANGLGDDFQVQADAVGSFVVPEPLSVTLWALACAALAATGRKRFA
jgi:hypothetical protein